MHAIVEIAGKQFRVANNTKLKVPLLAAKEGDKVNFDKVFAYEEDGGKTVFGSPLLDNMSVDATVLEHGRDKKVIVFKKKRRKGYQKKNGHRQDFSLIEINNIGSAKKTAKKAAEPKETAKAEVKATAPKKAEEKAEVKTEKKATPKKAATAKTEKKSETKKVATATKKTTAKKSTATKAKETKSATTKAKTTKPKSTAKKADSKTKAKEE